jgi:EAL domain-containing protein
VGGDAGAPPLERFLCAAVAAASTTLSAARLAIRSSPRPAGCSREGLILPGVLLPIAERLDLIDRIDRWVIREAVRLLAGEQHAGHAIRLFVNLSAVSIADETLPELIAAELENHRADGRGLCFEITETAAIIDMDRARRLAASISKLGCRFTLDDFGTGFASFYYLKHLPFDHIKIDGEFRPDGPGARAGHAAIDTTALTRPGGRAHESCDAPWRAEAPDLPGEVVTTPSRTRPRTASLTQTGRPSTGRRTRW